MDTTSYDLYRDRMQTGDAIVFCGAGLISKLIQWRTRSPYSHVAMIARWKPYQNERVMLFHATAQFGVNMVPVSRYLAEFQGAAWWVPLRREGLPVDASLRLLDEAAQDCGRAYDVEGILSFILPSFKQQDADRFCSEQYALWLTKVGLAQETFVSPGSFIRQPCFKTPVILV